MPTTSLFLRTTTTPRSWKQVVEQILRQYSNLTLYAVVQQQARRDRRPVQTPSPPPLARMDNAILRVHGQLYRSSCLNGQEFEQRRLCLSHAISFDILGLIVYEPHCLGRARASSGCLHLLPTCVQLIRAKVASKTRLMPQVANTMNGSLNSTAYQRFSYVCVGSLQILH
jgi:hypothetical protein